MSENTTLRDVLISTSYRTMEGHWECDLDFSPNGRVTFVETYRSVHAPGGPTSFDKTYSGDFHVDETARTVTIRNVILPDQGGTTEAGAEPTVLHVSADGEKISGKFGPVSVDVHKYELDLSSLIPPGFLKG
mmetsp:Transcript_20185/g.56800  ORF Transcript_20185/g.56800 Transcript_20185/m.56800 type:complete len:132 (-) Transcript_20185:200-595(-)